MNKFIRDISKIYLTASVRTHKRVTEKLLIPEPGCCRELLLKYIYNMVPLSNFLVLTEGREPHYHQEAFHYQKLPALPKVGYQSSCQL